MQNFRGNVIRARFRPRSRFNGRNPEEENVVSFTDARKTHIQKKLFRAIASYDKEALEASLRDGANANALDTAGWTPIYLATYKANITALEILLKAGADPNKRTSSGDTPLCLAAENLDEGVVDALLPGGASKSEKRMGDDTYFSLTPFEIAKEEVKRGGLEDCPLHRRLLDKLRL